MGAVELMKGETMTLQEISRYFHLNETIEKNREALKFLRQRAEPAAPSLNGMPHASGVKDSTGRLAVEIADMDARITYLEEQAEQERDKAIAFCDTIQDARLYLIFRLRFVRCLTWTEVADLMGDYYTDAGVCKIGIQLIVLCYLKVTWYDMFRSASCCYNIVTAMNQTSRAEKRKEKQKMYTVTFSNEELEEMKANDAVVIVSCDDDNGHRLY